MTDLLLTGRHVFRTYPEIADVVEAASNEHGCFGSCDAGRVRGAHLANHTAMCARLQMMLGQPIPDDYVWDGTKLVYTAGATA